MGLGNARMSSCEMSWAVELLPRLCLLPWLGNEEGVTPPRGRGALRRSPDPQGVTSSMGKGHRGEMRSQRGLRVLLGGPSPLSPLPQLPS